MPEATAIEMGFYNGKRIRKGKKFQVSDGAKGKWFTVEGKTVGKAKPTSKAKPATKAESSAEETPAEE
jgi:hypothetical protein